MLRDRSTLAILASVVLALAYPAHAVTPDEILSDPALESRARSLSAGLRCLVCQNQSIDDSDAPLARDLRLLVRERLTAGDTDEEIERFVVARYGEFVLLKPPLTSHTLLLWLAPFLVVLGGIALVATRLYPNRAAPQVATADALTEAERARLAGILDRDRDNPRS